MCAQSTIKEDIMSMKVDKKVTTTQPTQKPTPNEKRVKSEADQIGLQVKKLKEFSVKSNENRDLVRDQIFTHLLGGDKQSRIETLAKLIILEKEKANPEDIASAQKTLLEGGILEGMLKEKMTRVNTPENLLQSQFIIPQSIVTIDFNEYTFYDLDQQISVLFKSIDSVKSGLESDIKVVIGATGTLLPSLSDYEKQKEEAAKMFDSYNTHYNDAVMNLKKIHVQESSVIKLNETITKTIQEFLGLNQKRITFLTNLYTDVSHQHNLLADKVEFGRETYTTKIWGGSSVKVPLPNNLQDRYVPLQKACEFPNKHTLENFSGLFELSHKYYSNSDKFFERTLTHLSEVTATNTALIDSNPKFAEAKDKGKLLPENYKELHDRCLDFYAFLQNSSELLVDLEKTLKEVTAKKLVEISDRKKNLIELTNTLENTYKSLDRAIHSGQEVKTKEFKTLTEKSAYELPVSK